MQPFRDLRVWKRAFALAAEIYGLTRQYPDDERYGLISQTRRAANSIGSNIAEGVGRESPADFARFLRYAVGSVNEVEHHLLLARELGYLQPFDHRRAEEDLHDIRRMLFGLTRRLIGERITEN